MLLGIFERSRRKESRAKTSFRCRPTMEQLETRDLMAVGVGVRLDFGNASGSNSFHERLVELTNRLGVFPLTTTEELNVKNKLISTLTDLGTQASFNVVTTATNPYDFPETVFFGRKPTDVGSTAGSVYQSTLDWRNGNLSTEYVFPSELMGTAPPADTSRAQLVKFISNSLIHASGTAIGLGLGMDAVTAFGDPSLTQVIQANTNGIPTRNLGADATIGFAQSQLYTDEGYAVAFRYSPVAMAQIQFGEGIRTAVPGNPNVQTEEGALPHNTTQTAQPLTLKLAASGASNTSGAKIAFLGFGKITNNEKDFYSFTAATSDLVTVRVSSAVAYPGVAFDTVLKLIGPDGQTVLSTSTDIRYDSNSFGSASDPVQSTDSMILNFRIPAAGTYYLEVSSNGGGLAGLLPYDLVIASWAAQAHPFQSLSTAGVEDVNNDGFVSPADALTVINQLNSAAGSRQLANPMIGVEQAAMIYQDINGDGQITAIDKAGIDLTPTLGYVDVNGDGFISPADALTVINRLNNPPANSEQVLGAASVVAAAEGEASAEAVDGKLVEQMDLLFALYYGSETQSISSGYRNKR